MSKDFVKVLVVALVAILLTLMVLLFVAANPWMLAGVAAVLFAIAAIIHAINGGSTSGSSTNGVATPFSTPTGDAGNDNQAPE